MGAATYGGYDLMSEHSRRGAADFIQDEEEIKSVVCDMDNQRVVRADAERTRGQEQLDKDLIELVLTKYCKNNNIKYKQGLNEVRKQSFFGLIK
jgi:GTP-binding protein EngB required for normal cell division